MRFHAASTLCVFLFAVAPAAFAGEAKPKPTLDETYRQWHKGLSSKSKEEREKTLRSMLPTQKDMEYLFPKHAEKLAPLIAKGTQFYVENVDKIAEEITKSGAIKTITTRDLREKDPSASHKRLFEVIPKEVPVLAVSVRYENGDGSGAEFYVYLNQRWVWIAGLDSLPDVLDKLK